MHLDNSLQMAFNIWYLDCQRGLAWHTFQGNYIRHSFTYIQSLEVGREDGNLCGCNLFKEKQNSNSTPSRRRIKPLLDIYVDSFRPWGARCRQIISVSGAQIDSCLSLWTQKWYGASTTLNISVLARWKWKVSIHSETERENVGQRSRV